MNKSRHVDVKIVDVEAASDLVNSPRFSTLDELSDTCFEVTSKKKSIRHNLPIQIGFFVYSYAKLRMLAFYFDVLVRYIPRPLFSLCEMDTDSLYMALAAETLDELVTSDLKSEWLVAKSHWFPRSDTAENAAYDKRTPGLFKIEWSGGGFVGLAAKTYFCFNPDNRQKEKCSTKGINKAAKISIDHFRSVLHTKQSVSSTNRGFILKDNNMLSYAMERSGLSYFYCKRKVLNDGTAPHLAAALYRNVEIYAGSTSLVQSFDNAYAMTKFWETTLNTRSGAHPHLHSKEGYYIDRVHSKAHSEDVDYFPADGNTMNFGGKYRAENIAEGKKVCLVSDLDASLFKQDKLLPSELEMQVSLTKNYSEFILLSADNQTNKVVFDKVTLRCTFQRPQDSVLGIIEQRLAKENAIYHTDRSVLSFHAIPEGAADMTVSSIFGSKLPHTFLVGVQDRSSFGKTRSKNPFTLYPMKSFQAYIDGQEHFPRAVELVGTNDFTYMWEAFLDQSGHINDGDNLLEHYYPAYPAIMVDLTQDRSQNQRALNLQRSGTVRLQISFPEAAPAGRVLMILAWYDEVLEITKDRQVMVI
ncbi:hypothetical protein ACHWQZ_G008450 [Mnemiopsis leidyi]